MSVSRMLNIRTKYIAKEYENIENKTQISKETLHTEFLFVVQKENEDEIAILCMIL